MGYVGSLGRLAPTTLLLVAVMVLQPFASTVLAVPSQAPMMDVSVHIEPDSMEVFPTYTWSMPIYLLATVSLEKYRPDEVYVDLECSVDNHWVIDFKPRVMVFRRVGTLSANCEITLVVPPRTVGPITVTVELTATVRVVGRTIEDTGRSVITFIEDTDQFMDKVPERIVVLGDGGVDGEVRVYNLHDHELEFHLCALGEWGERIPDLDFQLPIVLGPNQMQIARFHGQLDDEVGTGEYDIELALWTPDVEGNRTYVTSENVTLVVTREVDSLMESLLTVALVVLAVSLVVLGYVLMRVFRGKGVRIPGSSALHRMGGLLRPPRGRGGETPTEEGGPGVEGG